MDFIFTEFNEDPLLKTKSKICKSVSLETEINDDYYEFDFDPDNCFDNNFYNLIE